MATFFMVQVLRLSWMPSMTNTKFQLQSGEGNRKSCLMG